jgi:hypothetical protein
MAQAVARNRQDLLKALSTITSELLKEKGYICFIDVLKVFQSCGYATLSQTQRHPNRREGSDDYPSAALSLLPRDRYCQAWSAPEGKQRYRCRTCLEGRGRTFLLEYTYAGQSPEVKQQIVDMVMNASGIRDTARVLHVSPRL